MKNDALKDYIANRNEAVEKEAARRAKAKDHKRRDKRRMVIKEKRGF